MPARRPASVGYARPVPVNPVTRSPVLTMDVDADDDSQLQPSRKRRARQSKVSRPAGEVLDPTLNADDFENFSSAMRARVIGQDEAVDAFASAMQIFRTGLASPSRPLGSFMFLGPTGTGKTNLVEAAAEVCFDDRRAMLKVDCAEFSHSHEIARLIGSPPGYLGHQETNPYLSSVNVLRYQTADCPFTLLLFDEIEKANNALWQLLLGIMDKGRLTLGTNKEVDLSSCFIFLTSNVGARSVSDILAPEMGFTSGRSRRESDELVHRRIEDAVLWKARRTFSPEFLNRLDYKIVFQRLTLEHMKRILDIELRAIWTRFSKRGEPIDFDWTDALKQRLLEEGFSEEYGARPLKRLLEQKIVFPLARLLASRQLVGGEAVKVDYNRNKGVTFVLLSPSSRGRRSAAAGRYY